MNINFFIEAFGYLGSFLVLVSFLMTSVVRLRIVNTIGSVIFMIYAFIIHSYPTAFMNAALVLINLHFLWKMNQMEKEYCVVETDPDDKLLKHFLNVYGEDIEKCFPGTALDLKTYNKAYVVISNEKPVGITLGTLEGDELDLILDYSIPEYRDFSIGIYLYEQLAKAGIKKVYFSGPVENHREYLKRQGFMKVDGRFTKEL